MMNQFLHSNTAIVSIQKSTYDNLNIESLLKPIGGFKNYISKGERVLLKTNLLNATEPEKCIVTNPVVISAVAKSVLKVGGIPFIGDSPSGQFTKRRLKRVYKKSGLIKLSKQLGIELNYDTSSKKIDFPNGKRLQKIPIYNFVLNADKIISLPKIKTHSFMMMTLATKIMFGSIPGLTKAKYHSMFLRRKEFAEMLIDVLLVAKPNLIIMDGVVGMQGEGPSSGDPVELEVMLASENSVALDLAICKMLDIEPIGIPTLKEAKIRNLWPLQIDYPLLSPKDVKYTGFILLSSAGYLLTGKKTPDRFPCPNVKCIGCDQCVEVCSRKAIKIVDKKAKIDYSKCIKCYCCHEVYTYNAIDLETMI
ncbi:MAG: DUF362 domain-containing protein [Candidatus Thermoplasmatota archaeon]|nr:DUF362 domain-containing protein [Candidatus Thermoplasmatota archaeon]